MQVGRPRQANPSPTGSLPPGDPVSLDPRQKLFPGAPRTPRLEVGIRETHAVATVPFGPVQSAVSELDKLLKLRPLRRHQRYTTDRHREQPLLGGPFGRRAAQSGRMSNAQVADGRTNRLGNVSSALGRRVRQQNTELLTPETGHQVARS
jgi:hypothetical protein